MKDKWYFAEQGKGYGPFSLKQLNLLLGCGLILPKDLVWHEGAEEASRAEDMEDLHEDGTGALAKPSHHKKSRSSVKICGLLLVVGALLLTGMFVLRSSNPAGGGNAASGDSNGGSAPPPTVVAAVAAKPEAVPARPKKTEVKQAGKPPENSPQLGPPKPPKDGRPPATASVVGSLQQARQDESRVGEVWKQSAHRGGVTCMSVSPDGRVAVSTGRDKSVRAWSLPSGQLLWEQRDIETHALAVAVGADGATVYCCDRSRLTVRDAASGRLTRSYPVPRGEVAAFSRDGHSLVLILPDQKGQVIDTRSGDVLHRIASPSVISCVGFTNDQSKVIYGWAGLHLDDLKSGQSAKRRIYIPSHSYVHALAFSPDDKYLLTGSGKIWSQQRGTQMGDRLIRLWEVQSGTEVASFEDHKDWLYAVAFSPDGRRFLSAGGGSPDDWKGSRADADREVRYWDVDKRRVLHRFSGHEAAVKYLVVLPDGKHFLSGSDDDTVRMWRLPD